MTTLNESIQALVKAHAFSVPSVGGYVGAVRFVASKDAKAFASDLTRIVVARASSES